VIRRERMALLAITTVTAVTRWLALSATPWDWDEFLFMLGMRHYDVASHHPHPPGFPLFIFFADLLQRLGLSDFHALQAIAFLGAVAVVPAAYFLCRELEMTATSSLIAAALLAFFPNVWFYGGTALSDVPSMTLVILAAALLLRGRRDVRAYFAGAVVLAIAAGFRPQNLLVGLVPALLASRAQGWKRMLAAAAIGAAIIAASYGAAAERTGVRDYREALAEHQRYITAVDSFHAPARPPLRNLVDDFFLRPYRQPLINIVISVLAAAGAVTLRRSVLLALAMFAPLSILAFLYLDFHSVSRFSIGYIPVVAILAAEGLELLTRKAAPAVALVIVAGMIVWSWPAIREAHVHASPPFAAMTWLRAHAARTYVHGSMRPFAEYFLGGRIEAVDARYPPAVWPADERNFFVAEKIVRAPGATYFTRPHNALFDIARQRYFEVTVVPLAPIVPAAWYGEERGGGSAWEWTGHSGAVQLPPLPGRARLTVRFYVPLNALKTPPNVTLTLDGRVIDRIRATTGAIERTYKVDPGRTLVIETDEVVNPAAAHLGDDPRDLGLRLNGIVWSLAR
jgi:hypothetical protein